MHLISLVEFYITMFYKFPVLKQLLNNSKLRYLLAATTAAGCRKIFLVMVINLISGEIIIENETSEFS